MAVAGLHAPVMTDQHHVAVAAGDAHFFNYAVAGGVYGVRVAGGKIDAVVTSYTIVAIAETRRETGASNRRARYSHAGDARKRRIPYDMLFTVDGRRIVDVTAVAQMQDSFKHAG